MREEEIGGGHNDRWGGMGTNEQTMTASLGVETRNNQKQKAKINALGNLGFRIDCHETEFY